MCCAFHFDIQWGNNLLTFLGNTTFTENSLASESPILSIYFRYRLCPVQFYPDSVIPKNVVDHFHHFLMGKKLRIQSSTFSEEIHPTRNMNFCWYEHFYWTNWSEHLKYTFYVLIDVHAIFESTIWFKFCWVSLGTEYFQNKHFDVK